ncbi:MAG: fasciclin domain-containing protein [Psychroserpens sp.]|nr:fasciclin domain-containing protein [Psychroserpens sp.]MBO6631924.1 fasciclin domain-containing protein [Psychroserpens sp.]MBO6654059.1 fasciclin domain-containing protein [Psychroserpens sp.]MBO6682655.1 fasciclin domain-containing protein [Psychroserpens sp.]MBO6750685.1 fasciclin domain-containing protein [Psychroserpens sp.]
MLNNKQKLKKMKIISKTLRLLPLFLFVFAFQACSDDDDNNIVVPTPQNIVELASSNPNLSSLVQAILAADGDLATVLSGPGPFTVLAPTNDAFDAFLGDDELSDIPTDVLEQVLRNHVISGNITSSTLVGLGSGYERTLAAGAAGQNLSIYFDTTGGVSFNGVANVVTGGADVEASNGTVHIIDGVIGLPTVVDHALANPAFSSLVAALSAADEDPDTDLIGTLSGAGTFTVLAPTNDAFTAFLDGASLGDIPNDVLTNVLLNHVLGSNILANDLLTAGAGYNNTLAAGPNDAADNATNVSIYFNTSDGVVFNGVATVVVADVVGTNGIVHAINAVINIPTVVTFALADPNFSTLVAALTDLTPNTDFAGILSRTEGMNMDGINPNFTVFAPTNDAFAALAAVPDEPVLTQVLLHHVISEANIVSGNLTDGVSPGMLNGQNITINLPGTGDNIADVTDAAGNADIGIVAVDVQAGNGVIHVLNKVMLPADE